MTSGAMRDIAAAGQRVMFVGPSAAALAVLAGRLIFDIRKRGHAVFSVTPLRDEAGIRALSRLGVETHALPVFRQGFAPLADRRSTAGLARTFRDLRPDIMVAYGSKTAALGVLAASRSEVPHAVTVIPELGPGFAETPEPALWLERQMQKDYLRLAFRLSHAAIFLNEHSLKTLSASGLIPPHLPHVTVMGCGVDLRYFPPTDLPPLNSGIVFLFAGPLDKRLGAQDYCRAASLIKRKGGTVLCLLVGPEARGPSALPLAEVRQHGEAVRYLGVDTDPRPYLARSHVFVMPAHGDLVPQALLEALALGRPIITANSRGCRIAVRDGVNGLMVPVADPEALAAAMTRLLQRPDLMPPMARASRHMAVEHFDVNKINAVMLRVLGLTEPM